MEPSDHTPVPKPRRLSSFSVILVMTTLMIVGIGMIPLLNIQYAPQTQLPQLTINFTWPDASARVVEAEATSRIEGVLAVMSGIKSMSSTSYKGRGQLSLTFKKSENIDALRFEVATLLKQLYPRLPEGVSYPTLSSNTFGGKPNTILIYTINSPLSSIQIEQYADEHLRTALSTIEGVSGVHLSGATPYEWMVTFNAGQCETLGISPAEIGNAVNSHFQKQVIGMAEQTNDGQTLQYRVILHDQANYDAYKRPDWEAIPVKRVQGRMISLGEIATIRYMEQEPTSYFRINGLNNIMLTIEAEGKVNTIAVAAKVESRMQELQLQAGEDFSFIKSLDSSKRIKEDLSKIYLRTIMCLVILLGFVYLVSRNVRYLILIVIALAANISIAFIFYKLLGIELHLYSLAGITVSLGLVIDTSIIMIDHYRHYRNLKVFIAILAALLTTIGSLSIVFFLPEEERANLSDFAAVIIINLSISLLIALFFIPALYEKMPIVAQPQRKLYKRRRLIVRFTHGYRSFIIWGKRHKWLFIVVLVLAFGIPVHLLPSKITDEKTGRERQEFFPRWYNKTVGTPFYREKVKPIVDPLLGGSLRLFTRDLSSGNIFRDPSRTQITISASMPEGCTIRQLNELILKMENFLSQYDEIDMYRTQITAYNNGYIGVTFKKESEASGFPLLLYEAIVDEATNLGGAEWGVSGAGQGFSNALMRSFKSSRISLTGYDYGQLYKYAQDLVDTLQANRRVSGPGIFAGDVRSFLSATEYYMDFNDERFAMATAGSTPRTLHNLLHTKLYQTRLGDIHINGRTQHVRLMSDERNTFDVWNLQNNIVSTGSEALKFSDFGTIGKRQSGIDIFKKDQQYQLIVAYDFVGAYELNKRILERTTESLNARLPLGYKAVNDSSYGSWHTEKNNYLLLLLVVSIIYFICAILFESIVQPLVIILMIPVAFIGVFLTFSLFDFPFDQGGFAAFVLLSGLVVNAGIYTVHEFNTISYAAGRRSLRNYLRAFNHKIIPIMLTVISTTLGLMPFVYGGKEDVFWFSFAVGSIGGLLFSMIALLFYLPVFIPSANHSKKDIM